MTPVTFSNAGQTATLVLSLTDFWDEELIGIYSISSGTTDDIDLPLLPARTDRSKYCAVNEGTLTLTTTLED